MLILPSNNYICSIFYLRVSISISIGVFIVSAIQLGILIFYMETLFLDLHLLYICSFIIAWVSQFIGHKI